MHIPNAMLQGPICPVTAVVSAIAVIVAAFKAVRSDNKPTAARFGAITALIFAGQMMNFPIQDGTSGHLIGGVLASALLGTPFGVLAMALVVTIQCLVFSDGGFTVLGANVLNMAVIGAGLGGIIRTYILKIYPVKIYSVKSSQYMAGLGLTAWLSVMLAALACSIELAVSGTIAFPVVIGAMLGTHALIGIGEGWITVAACFAFAQEPTGVSRRRSVTAPLVAAGVIATMLSPFASGFPDGLEWVAEKYQFLHESAPAFVGFFPDYTVPSISNEMLTTGLAGLVGVIVTFFIALGVAKLFHKPGRMETT
ncbi:MAG: energy-coupling factor ABC transporter permease [Candidatus Omnitrophota bacterium]|nr:energy-coupling factor ABC transporter permease [Candidatus Omnitrophota bacterium]